MTNETIRRIAYGQSAIDCNCEPGDFLRDEPVFTISRPHPRARKYLPLPMGCDLVSYGRNVVAQTSPECAGAVREYLSRVDTAHCMETPGIHLLDTLLAPYGLKTCFQAEYFLPDVDLLEELPCEFELRILTQEDFRELYLPQWSNALCKDRRHLDVLGVGAYDGQTLVGLAGCSADCDEMWQIGVDVLPEYRRRGIAAAVTSRLAIEILNRGKVPFYCAAWCNLTSVRNAIRCGFRPAWVSLSAAAPEILEKMNG